MNTAHIILKITGEAFINKQTKEHDLTLIKNVAEQIKNLKNIKFGIVVGGGNFFRGSIQGKAMGLTQSNAHYVGMMATVMNGIIIKNVFDSIGLESTILSALNCPEISEYISQDRIDQAITENKIIIFTGGTGNPFFSTDTNAVLRALQFGAQVVWKGTKVDGIYSKDPIKHTDAKLYKQVSYTQALDEKLKILDSSAIALAEEYKVKIRVFNIFEDNAILKAADSNEFGSLIY